MASRHGFVDAKIARVLDDGRGEGAESDYKPWLTVRDVPSRGRSHWLLAAVTLRAHQLLSDLERGAFLIYDFRNDVRDIREEFPLDLSQTRDIAQAAGIADPVDSNSRTNLVQTTDLVVDLEREARI